MPPIEYIWFWIFRNLDWSIEEYYEVLEEGDQEELLEVLNDIKTNFIKAKKLFSKEGEELERVIKLFKSMKEDEFSPLENLEYSEETKEFKINWNRNIERELEILKDKKKVITINEEPKKLKGEDDKRKN